MFGGIDHVRAPGGGRIGLVRCPGTACPAVTVRPAAPDTDADLRELQAWRTQGLVTLLEPFELTLLGVEDLGEHVRARGMEWWHLPITDGAAPGRDFEDHWQGAAERLHAILDGDGRIVLHCRAGIGRSGSIAARLLVERGTDPAAALEAVRRARYGAVETGEQERWVRSLTPRIR